MELLYGRNGNLGLSEEMYRELLEVENRFVNRHKDFFAYLKNRREDLDEQYFLRANQPVFYPFHECQLDPTEHRYNTTYGKLAGLLHGSECFIKKLQLMLSGKEKFGQGASTWEFTGSKVDFTELCLALKPYLREPVSKKEVSMSELVEQLGKHFNVTVPNVYSTMNDIKNRKQKARFLKRVLETFSV